MYEIKIDNNRKIDVPDYSEVYGILKKKSIEKEEFYQKTAKEIESVYDAISFRTQNSIEKKEKMLFIAAKGEMLIDRCYNFLVNGEGNFTDYYNEIKIDDKRVEKIVKGEEGYIFAESNPICFDAEEIRKKYMEYESDEMGVFYYSAFTKFYLEGYLLQQMAIFIELYKGGSFNYNEVKKLHEYLVNIFTADFSEAFRRFEEKTVN